jgi:carboxymethylenebutenolidase
MEPTMSAEPLLTSDVVGLTKIAPLSRRGFMTASAAVTAGYTLAAGPVRADVITTDTNGLTAGDAKIKVAEGEMPGYFARPTGVNNPPVVLVAMEIFGLHEYIKDVTRRLAKLGALAVAPDYYFDEGPDLTKITDIPKLLPIVNAKPDVELLSDLDNTVAWAKSQGGDTSRLGIIGFCRGGRTVWEYAAHSTTLKAGASFYGPPVDPPNPLWPKSPTQLAPEMKAPVIGFYGEADTGIPGASVEALKAALAENKKPAEFHLYPGAPHGFHADYRASYRKEAAEDAWSNMQAWFKKYGVLS